MSGRTTRWRKSLRGATGFALLLATCAPGAAAEDPGAEESRFLERVRRLTFEGRRSGEGYFSADGRRLVFQSEREPDNPFYQIYELDLETGETRRVSTGTGKTTCAYFHPDGRNILFASTHHDPNTAELQRAELERRESGEQRRYEWDYDPEMELYVADSEAGKLLRLTDVRGYDAEGSYSPDGEWIVFASNREAYQRELSEEEQAKLEVDPAYFAELYLMRAGGTGLRRLTDVPGYDGGPFFSADGSKIFWRRFDAEGLIADIWSADAENDFAEAGHRRLTDFESMSWAPFPHPSGDYVIFTSNKHGFDNFELFIVDASGRKQPVRVTQTPGFDGLPVFSPDGERLVWTSTRYAEDGKGQLFIAGWNHEEALRALRKAPRRGTAPPVSAEEP